MTRILAKSPQSELAYTMITNLQSYFVTKLNRLSDTFGQSKHYEPVEWFRDEGLHGGGVRYVAHDEMVFNRASVNISQVQYEDTPEKNLVSATALSTIIHPLNPHAPSIHMHISWTELKGAKGYWRVMADLNPSVFYEEDKEVFDKTLKVQAKEHYDAGSTGGELYFKIPVLKCHRGVSHFYLEGFSSDDTDADLAFSQNMGEKVVDTYIEIVSNALQTRKSVDATVLKAQRDYHSVYLLQVLTLDRGTTSGLLVHNQNDVGTLGSIPKYVDVDLLSSWIKLMPSPQDVLLTHIVADLPESGLVDDDVKAKLAQTVREHYTRHPDALNLQAAGQSIPTTVANHK